jgi:hypothetical protein
VAGSSTTSVADRQTSVAAQTSAYGGPVPVIFGTTRVASNLIWLGNFQSKAATTTAGGKGGSSSNTTYTYTGAAILSICEGQITGIGTVWKDANITTLSALGLSFFSGAATQATWSFLTGWSNSTNWVRDVAYGYAGSSPAFTSQALNYSSLAYVAASSFDLGSGANVPNLEFEVQGFNIIGGGNPDANPANVVTQILTNVQYGGYFNSASLDALTSWSTYCQALGLFVSPAYTQQRATTDCIMELCDATNAAPVWSNGVLKIIPYGDKAITGNGITYTPNTTPLYDLADDDFQGDAAEPILVTRVTPADAYNRSQMQFRNRVNQYATEVVGVEDQNAIELYGLQTASQVTCDFICTSAIAKQSLQLKLQRMLYIRNTYEFELGARYAALEPMDIVTLTDPALGLSRTAVRIIKIEEQDHSFKITAEDFPIGAANAATYTHDNGLHWTNASNLTPSNCAAPFIFELPADPSTTGLSVAIATGGQTTDLVYGGCRVWLSLDGVNYKAEGTISGSARYGTTTASLASHAAGNDTTSTLAVGLLSGGQLISGSAADASKGTTLIYVSGEYLAYQTATLTGTNAYNLTTLNRGLYSTPTSRAASGSAWARVDSSIFALRDLDLSMIGQTVYIKLTAFNTYEGAEQSLASVTAYTYTITGAMKALETTLFKGLYSSSTVYSIGMVVDLADGSTYQYINLTPAAGFAVTNTAYWEQLAPPSSLGSLTGSVDFATQVGGTAKPANNATVGAQVGTNLLDQSGAAIATDAAIKNAAITITSGAISGIGTGSGTVVANSAITTNADGTLTGAGAGTAPVLSSIAGSLDLTTAKITNKSLANLDITASTKLGTVATGATKNVTTSSSTAPVSPTDGDIWIDTSTNPNTTKTRISGAWVIGATYVTNTNQVTDGAGLGTTAVWGSVSSRPANIAALSGAEAIQNSGITLSAAGALSGAGGGSVTFAGLGGTSLGQQASLKLGGAYLFRTDGTTALTDSNVVTSLGTAAAISGQGALATSTLTAAQVTNANVSINAAGVLSGAGGGAVTFGGLGGGAVGQQASLKLGGAYLFRTDGTTALTDSNVVTSLGTAAAISGQGALATLSAVNLATQVSGTLGTGNAAAGLINSNVTPATLTYTVGGATLDSLKPAQVGADVTASNVAASIASQGALATSTLTAAQVANANVSINAAGVLSGAGGGAVTFGGLGGGAVGQQASLKLGGAYLFRTDGTTVLTDNNVVTSLGVASAITGQGSLATLSSVAYGSGNVTGFGALAAKSTASIDTDIVDGTNYFRYPTADKSKLSGVQAGADVTASHTASAIIGQAATATSSDYSAVTGTKPPTNADNTAASVPTVTGNTNINLQANYLGSITTSLPFDVIFIARQGTTDVTATTTFALSNVGSTAATVNTNGNGKVTIGTGTSGSGMMTLTSTFPNGAIVNTILTLSVTKDNPPPSSGSTYGDFNSFANTTGTTSSLVGSEVAVQSDSSGKLYITVNLTTYAKNTNEIPGIAYAKVARASTSGGTLTDVFADTVPSTTGSDGIGSGSIYLAKTQYTMPAANTVYYFKVYARDDGNTRMRIYGNVHIGQT